jgi:hypothetical protein
MYHNDIIRNLERVVLHSEYGLPHCTDGHAVVMMKDGEIYSREYYQYGELHREGDLPAVEYENGDVEYYKFGKLHRDGDSPARIIGELVEYYKFGKLHRDGDSPARIDGQSKTWAKHGRLHRVGKPAKIDNGIEKWYLVGTLDSFNGEEIETAHYHEGKLHHEKRPAIRFPDGDEIWYYRGKLHNLYEPSIISPERLHYISDEKKVPEGIINFLKSQNSRIRIWLDKNKLRVGAEQFNVELEDGTKMLFNISYVMKYLSDGIFVDEKHVIISSELGFRKLLTSGLENVVRSLKVALPLLEKHNYTFRNKLTITREKFFGEFSISDEDYFIVSENSSRYSTDIDGVKEIYESGSRIYCSIIPISKVKSAKK